MTRLYQLQQLMQQQLLRPSLSAEQWLIKEIVKPERLHIYEHAYRSRLQEVLDNEFPVLKQLIPAATWQMLTNLYIDSHPSHATSLNAYAGDFAEVVASGGDHAWEEMARFERAMSMAIEAKNESSKQRTDLQAIPDVNWGQIQVAFHPSLYCLSSHYNTIDVWQAYKQRQALVASVRFPVSQTILVWRRQQRIYFEAYTGLADHVLQMALTGCTFGQICEALAEQMEPALVPEFALTRLLHWLENDMIIDLGVLA